MVEHAADDAKVPGNLMEERKWDLELVGILKNNQRPQSGGMVRGMGDDVHRWKYFYPDLKNLHAADNHEATFGFDFESRSGRPALGPESAQAQRSNAAFLRAFAEKPAQRVADAAQSATPAAPQQDAAPSNAPPLCSEAAEDIAEHELICQVEKNAFFENMVDLNGATFDVEASGSELPAPASPPTPKLCPGVEPGDIDNPFWKERMAESKHAAQEFAQRARKFHGALFDLSTPPRKQRRVEGAGDDATQAEGAGNGEAKPTQDLD